MKILILIDKILYCLAIQIDRRWWHLLEREGGIEPAEICWRYSSSYRRREQYLKSWLATPPLHPQTGTKGFADTSTAAARSRSELLTATPAAAACTSSVQQFMYACSLSQKIAWYCLRKVGHAHVPLYSIG